jgi:hypothetical protein
MNFPYVDCSAYLKQKGVLKRSGRFSRSTPNRVRSKTFQILIFGNSYGKLDRGIIPDGSDFPVKISTRA